MPTVPLPAKIRRQIVKLLAAGKTHREIANTCGVSIGTVANVKSEEIQGREARGVLDNIPGKLPVGKHEAIDLTGFPDPIQQTFEPFPIVQPGQCLVLSDVHLPYHDVTTVSLAVTEAKRRSVKVIVLNGDTMDCHSLSDHDKDHRAPRYVEEIRMTKAFLAWLRGQFPKAMIVMKEGNHEDRLIRYIIRKAPVFLGMDVFSTPSLLDLANLGIEWVGDKRTITLGALNLIHGHEYRGGVSSPVNPARGLYLKARSVAMAGHHHQTSEHHARDIRGRAEAAWSLGCACWLFPEYMPHNNWNHGFAFVQLDRSGEFVVENKRVLNGRIV